MGVKERTYNPNASYAERVLNALTDKLGITSPPTYTDGYGTTRDMDDARQDADKEKVQKTVENVTDALKVGAIGTGLLYGGKGIVNGTFWIYKQLPLWLQNGIDAGLTADGIANLFTNNGVQKTYKEAKKGNYGKAALSGIGDILNVLGSLNFTKKVIDKTKKLSSVFVDYPQLSQNLKEHIIKVGPTKDYSKSASLFAKRLDSGGAKRVNYPEYAMETLHNGKGPHMKLVVENNQHLIGKSIGNYVENYIPTQEVSGKVVGVARIDLQSMHPILDNSSIPKYYYNSGVVDIIDENGKRIVNKNINNSYTELTSEEKRDILDHELNHTLDLIFRVPERQYSPMGKFLDFNKFDKGGNADYFKDRIYLNGSSWNEVAPRVTQIKNFLGITDGKTLMTSESLRKGFEKYLEAGRFDNDISTLYNAVTDWNEFAKWVNKSVPAVGAYMLIRDKNGHISGKKVDKHNIYSK